MRILQAGAGGVGFYLLPPLLRAGYEVTLFDDDNLTGGKGHMRLPRATPSMMKVDLLRGFCLASMGDQGITVVKAKFTGEEVEAGDLVVDCTDMALSVRRGVWAKAKERGARCLRVSYDGKNHTVVVAEGLPLVGRSGGGYTDVPDMALSFAAGGIGAIAVMKVLAGWEPYVDFHISIADYFVDWNAGVAEAVAGPVVEVVAETSSERKVA